LFCQISEKQVIKNISCGLYFIRNQEQPLLNILNLSLVQTPECKASNSKVILSDLTMKTEEILALYDQQMRREIEFPGMRKDVLPNLVRLLRPAPGMSLIQYSHLNDKNADLAIQEQIEYFTRLNQPFEWSAYEHDQPADLRHRLEKHGFVAEDPGTIMVLDLQEAPQALLEPVTADVRMLTRQSQLDEVIKVVQGVWGGDFSWVSERLGGHLEMPGYLNVYAAYIDDQPVSSGWVYFYPHSQFAALYGGSTLEGYRKKGLYKAILAVRVQAAIQRGYRFLTIDATSMSRAITARHGFRQITTVVDYGWKVKAN
jgi:hypothetical protein